MKHKFQFHNKKCKYMNPFIFNNHKTFFIVYSGGYFENCTTHIL